MQPLCDVAPIFLRRLIRSSSRERSNECTDRQDDLLMAIAAGETIVSPMVAVVAHPDDETIGMGSRLTLMEKLTLLHVTDGAPANMRRARSLGFDSAAAYSSARFDEVRKALLVLGATPVRHVTFGFSDGDTVIHLAELIDRIEAALAGSTAVITHAYEGGHPDHDCCALAVQVACARITTAGGVAPKRLEFAGYHSRGGQLMVNRFWRHPRFPETTVRLSCRERKQKRNAMRAFQTQSFIMESFPPGDEAYRKAPSYDFFMPPPPADWYYDRYDWALKGDCWLRQIRDQLDTEEFREAVRGAGATAS